MSPTSEPARHVVQTISAKDLAAWRADGAREQPQLLDVRESWETALGTIDGSLLMPMGTIVARADELDPQRPLVCICHHGARSLQVAIYLRGRGFADIYNLAGGVDAWSRDVDPTLRRY